jgi:hypothetical protein
VIVKASRLGQGLDEATAEAILALPSEVQRDHRESLVLAKSGQVVNSSRLESRGQSRPPGGVLFALLYLRVESK